MFKNIDLKKVIYFENGATKTYEEALLELYKNLNLYTGVDEFNDEMLEGLSKCLSESFVAAAKEISEHTEQTSKAFEPVKILCDWLGSNNASNLSPAPGSDRPNDLTYELCQNLRPLSQSNAGFGLLFFIFESDNARLISNNEVPSDNFLSTSLYIRLLELLEQEGVVLCESDRFAWELFGDVAAFDTSNKTFIGELEKICNSNPIYKAVTDYKETVEEKEKTVFKFDKKENLATGANKYDIKPSRNLCYYLFQQQVFSEDVFNDLFDRLDESINSLKNSYEELSNDKAELAVNLAKWDVSEYFCRVWVVFESIYFKVSSERRSKYVAPHFSEDFIQDMRMRCYDGNFPVCERSSAIAPAKQFGVLGLFFRTLPCFSVANSTKYGDERFFGKNQGQAPSTAPSASW